MKKNQKSKEEMAREIVPKLTEKKKRWLKDINGEEEEESFCELSSIF